MVWNASDSAVESRATNQGGAAGAIGGTLAGTLSRENMGGTFNKSLYLGGVAGLARGLAALFTTRGGMRLFVSGGVENMTLAGAAARGSHAVISETLGGRLLIRFNHNLGG